MNLARALRVLGPIDARSVARDPLLKWVVLYPFLAALALRFGVPPLTAWLRAGAGFDLEPYFPLLASSLIGLAPGIVGTVVGFLLIDERDERTLTALLVTPLPLSTYMLYRLAAPTLLGFAVTLAAYPLAALAPLPLGSLVTAAALGGFTAPLTALFLAGLAANKVSGFALMKVLSTINLLPVAAWFVDLPAQLLAGVVPGYWPMKMVWVAAAGGDVTAWGIAGLAVNLAAVAGCLVLFRKRTFGL